MPDPESLALLEQQQRLLDTGRLVEDFKETLMMTELKYVLRSLCKERKYQLEL